MLHHLSTLEKLTWKSPRASRWCKAFKVTSKRCRRVTASIKFPRKKSKPVWYTRWEKLEQACAF